MKCELKADSEAASDGSSTEEVDLVVEVAVEVRLIEEVDVAKG